MTAYTFDLMNPQVPALMQSGLIGPHGTDERHPLEQMRREQLKRIAIEKGFEVTDFHRKEDILLILRSGIRMQTRSAPPPPSLPQYGAAAPTRTLAKVDEADEAAARESVRSELKAMKFMKLKAVAKQYGLDCPGGMTPAQKASLQEELLKRIEADG